VEGIYSAESVQPLEKRLGKLSFVRSVRFDFSRHSYASSYFTIQFRDRALGGMSIEVSHIAPMFCWNFVPREGFGKPISWATPREVWKKIIRDYERALRRKTPVKAVAGIERVLDEMAAFGWIEISKMELERTPSAVAKVPKSLRKGSLAFFFFECLCLYPWPKKS
jgi:hypothetical protein